MHPCGVYVCGGYVTGGKSLSVGFFLGNYLCLRYLKLVVLFSGGRWRKGLYLGEDRGDFY